MVHRGERDSAAMCPRMQAPAGMHATSIIRMDGNCIAMEASQCMHGHRSTNADETLKSQAGTASRCCCIPIAAAAALLACRFTCGVISTASGSLLCGNGPPGSQSATCNLMWVMYRETDSREHRACTPPHCGSTRRVLKPSTYVQHTGCSTMAYSRPVPTHVFMQSMTKQATLSLSNFRT